ncbi:hypothetical protein RND81_09G194300 [Saponaria officinalis]|uniref:Uncharacterized protein n=1 Tax=Saponaria officinalis TaxID=3572 RepID=A0AAW1IMZ7_SAPOF
MAEPSSSSNPETKNITMAEASSSLEPEIKDSSTTTMAETSSSSKPETPTTTTMSEKSSSSLSPRPSQDEPKPKRLAVFGPKSDKFKNKAKGKQVMTYDFHFQLQPSKKFRHCIAALANHEFNPTKMGRLEVNESSLSITVYSASSAELGWGEDEVFGFLNLEAEFFNFFECINPVSKMIDLEIVLVGLSNGDDNSMLSVYSVHESNQVTFEYERGAKAEAAARPCVIDMVYVNLGYKMFPDVLSGLEASIPAILFRPFVKTILLHELDRRPDFVEVQMHPAKVQLKVGDNTVESAPMMGEVWLKWPYWETLRRASYTAEKCVVNVVTEPADSIMFMFYLVDPEEFLSFNQGIYGCNQGVSCLAFLRELT